MKESNTVTHRWIYYFLKKMSLQIVSNQKKEKQRCLAASSTLNIKRIRIKYIGVVHSEEILEYLLGFFFPAVSKRSL